MSFQEYIRQEYPDSNGCAMRIVGAMALFAATLIAFSMLTGCKSMQSVEMVNYRDSVITHVVYDTIRITITDTTHVEASKESEKESETEIVFGEGGGTYNTETGEATNVQSVKQSSKEKELQQLVMNQQTTIDKQSATINEQQNRITQLEQEVEEKQNTADIKPKRSGYDRFTSWGFWILIVLIVVVIAIRLWTRFYGLKR